jgi:hypothetical protein
MVNFGSLIVDSILGGFMDRVDQAIKQAEISGDNLLMRASERANVTVSNANFAFKDSMNTSFDRLDKSSQNSLLQIDSLLTDVENKTFKDMASVESRAQTIVNTLPFAKTDPRVRSHRPSFIVPTNPSKIEEVILEGNFVDASKPEYSPKLVIGNKTFNCSENYDERLRFSIPQQELTSRISSGLSSTPVTAIIPYAKGGMDISWLPKFFVDFLNGFFRTKGEANFKLLIGSLPASPGKITVWHKEISTHGETQHIVTQQWQQHSGDDDIPEHPASESIHYSSIPFELPWKVDPNTIQFKADWSQGRMQKPNQKNDDWDWRYSLLESGPVVTFGVATVKRFAGTSGKVNFHFEFDIYQDVQDERWVEEQISLKWGESRIFCYPNGSKVTFDSFDGNHQEFPGGHSPYINYRNLGNGQINIIAEKPSNIELT